MEIKDESPKEHQAAGQGAVFLCAVLWSTSGLFIKLIGWHPVIIAGLRSLVAALFMLAVRCFFTRPGKLSGGKAMWAGAVSYALTMIFFVVANKLTASANAILLQYSAPVWAAIFGWLLIREKPRWEHWGALVFVFAGLLFFFREGIESGALLGDGLAVLSGVLFGLNSVFLRMQKNGNPADSMLLSHVISFVISIPFIFLYPPDFTAQSVLIILFMGVIQLGCASLLFSYGLKRVSAIAAMLIATIEPVLNPVWVLLVTGEKPTVSAFIGGGVIIAAVLFSSIVGGYRTAGKRREKNGRNKPETVPDK